MPNMFHRREKGISEIYQYRCKTGWFFSNSKNLNGMPALKVKQDRTYKYGFEPETLKFSK